MLTTEFMLLFLVTTAFTSLILGALFVEYRLLSASASDLDSITRTRGASYAMQVWLSSGKTPDLDFRDEEVFFRVENNAFLVSYKGDVIEIPGVYIDDPREPV